MDESVVQGGMRALLAVLVSLALLSVGPLASSGLAGPAFAAEPKDKDAKGKDGDKNEGQFVNISPVALPVIVDGRLINFVFVTVRLNLAPFANAAAMRDKEPYFRDALMRTAYRQPFVVPTNYATIDVPALKSRMIGEAAKVAGPGVVTSVELIGEPQPKRVTGLPRPKGAPHENHDPIP